MAFNNEDRNGPIREKHGNITYTDRNENGVPDEAETAVKAIVILILIWFFGPLLFVGAIIFLIAGAFWGILSLNNAFAIIKYFFIALALFCILKVIIKEKSLSKARKTFLLIVGIGILLIILFLKIVIPFSFDDYSKSKTIELNGNSIQTLYGSTNYSAKPIISILVHDYEEDGIKGDLLTIFYREEIPSKYKDEYIEELEKDGFELIEVNEDDKLVKNNSNKTFTLIIISNYQIDYTVINGKYQDYEEYIREMKD